MMQTTYTKVFLNIALLVALIIFYCLFFLGFVISAHSTEVPNDYYKTKRNTLLEYSKKDGCYYLVTHDEPVLVVGHVDCIE